MVDKLDNEDAQPQSDGDPDRASGPATLQSTSLAKALNIARDRLLDRSLRNKLISTSVHNSKARQVRVFDELSDQVFEMLRSGKPMTFTPSSVGRQTTDEGGEPNTEDQVWAPEDDVAANDPGRHTDNKLQTKMTSEGLQKRLLSLFYEGQTLEEEQGVNVLFLAMGFLEWREARQSEIARFAPLILLPVELERDGAKDRFKLRLRDEDLITNVSLQAWLKDEFGLALPDLPERDDWTPAQYFEAVESAIGRRDGWRVHTNEILLGFFSFSKFLLWRDLDPASWPVASDLLDNPMLKAVLLRDDDESEVRDDPLVGPEDRIEDVFKPADLIHVTDADSSQAIAIQEALSGKNLVIQGPPGTGKSQTITNIIAGAVHAGKRVLFIAEKMAALEVVHDRLVKQKLGPICLELHSRKSSKTSVLEQIKGGRSAPVPPAWSSMPLDHLDETQTLLRAHSDRLHRCTGALSPFDLMGRISLLKGSGAPAPGFELAVATTWTREDLEQAKLRSARLGERLKNAGVPASHPWRGLGGSAPNVLEQDRLRALTAAADEAAKVLMEAVRNAAQILEQDEGANLVDLGDWVDALRLISARPSGLDETLVRPGLPGSVPQARAAIEATGKLEPLRKALQSAFRPEAWTEDWSKSRRLIAAKGRSWLRFLSQDYRTAIEHLRGVWQGDLPRQHGERLDRLDALIEAQSLVGELEALSPALEQALGSFWEGESTDFARLSAIADWTEAATALPSPLDIRCRDCLVDAAHAGQAAEILQSATAAVKDALDAVFDATKMDVSVCLDDDTLDHRSAEDVCALTDRWSEGFGDIAQWPPIRDDLAWLESLGCERFARQIFIGDVTASTVEPVLLLAAYEAMWKKSLATDPELDRINGDELDDLVRRFRKADQDRIRIAADEVARSHIDRHPTGSAGAVGILVDEMRKSRNLKPVRRLMLEAGDAIQRFKPVFLMSPLSVAQYLTPGRVEFDMLVIDEASQVRPEDALGAIARCRQLIVVGDDRQLPPTSFFSRMINDEPETEDEDASDGKGRAASVKDVESILNLCSRFPERMLKWHYRSEHPALIATSNRHFYKGELMLPPSVIAKANDGKTGLIFHETEAGHYERGRTARNEKEADDVAHAVLAHARECPELSLGIGTFSVAQRDCIRDRLDDLTRKHPELDGFIKAQAKTESVFVKNLENIQGDERDVIFISVGYGRDANGKLTQNFGPVGRDGGERRLNVLITRARKRCEVFSSLVAEDIRLDGAGKPGVQALKAFLKLAKDGYSALPENTGKGFDSDFEEAVSQAVLEMGYECRPQVGMAGFFIDLAVIDPRNEDRYLLGIECDGAAYHSSRYARDRDRIRQSILERRGWRIHRIWSTDWFYRREREVEKLRASIEAALQSAPHPESARSYEAAEPEPAETDTENLAAQEDDTSTVAAPVRTARPYEFADFTVGSTPVRPQDLKSSELVHWVTRIVEVEQPIHEDEVGRRLAMSCGWQRAGRVIRECAMKGLLAARQSGFLIEDRHFWMVNDDADVTPRDRSEIAASEPVRRIDMISPTEIAAAAIHALEENLALPLDELVIETARILGFARVGKDINSALRATIDTELDGQTSEDHLGRIRLLE